MSTRITGQLGRYRYPVAAAGELIVGNRIGAEATTRGLRGVFLAVSWGQHGEAGGVLDREMVRQLAADLISWDRRVELSYERIAEILDGRVP